MSTLPEAHDRVPEPKALGEEDYPPIGYAWYVVGVLLVAYIFSFIDRQILSLMVGPIKADLNISDTGMSYLMGISFALFYTFFGIPLGRLADRRSRRTIIAVGMAGWSLMTAACGLASRYWQLALLRTGVGVGEAALSPAAYSLIADYFPRHRLGTAMSVYSMGIFLGSGLAYLLGGMVVQFTSQGVMEEWPIVGAIRPWQAVFLVVGLPGILFAMAMYTIREPKRRGLSLAKAAAGVPVSETLAYLGRNKQSFFCHNFGFAMLALVNYGSAAWIPEFFVRTHGWTIGEVGSRFGLVVMIGGSLGIVSGGIIADALARRGYRDAKMRTGLAAAILSMVLSAFYPLVPGGWSALLLLVPVVYVQAMPFGVAPAAMQEMAPASMRGQAGALYLFVVTLVGLGVGPTAVAATTDHLLGDESLVRYSLLLVSCLASLVGAVLLWFSLRAFRTTVEDLEAGR